MRPIEVSRMEKPGEAIVGAIERPPDERRDMGRSQKAMAGELPDDRDITVGKAEGRRFRRSAEPRAAR